MADQHPGYHSTGWAREHANGRPVRLVQHHHAHIASVMGEHGLGADERVIGIAFDGTGYGTDGAVWGGEVLIAGYKSFRRAAHLAYVPLAGGDASVQRPYRMALAHLHAAGVPWDDDLPPVAGLPASANATVLAHQLETGFGCAPTSSMGRLFDAVASLAGVRHEVDYEAQAAIELERYARAPHSGRSGETRSDRYFPEVVASTAGAGQRESSAGDVGVDAVIRAVVADVRAGVATAEIAGPLPRLGGRPDRRARRAGPGGDRPERRRARRRRVPERGTAGGGARAARRARLHRSRPRLLPPNDGGLALGQLLIGAFWIGGWPMCLAVPGRILSTAEVDGTVMAEVDFGGVRKNVCLQYVPDAQVGEYVVVHVGFAIQRLDEQSAQDTLAEFEKLGILEEEFGDAFAQARRQKGLGT